MTRVLILTENISNENQFSKNLQRLNYEVFVSTSLLEIWRKTRTLSEDSRMFPLLILSETISNGEAEEIVLSVENQGFTFIRKVEEPPKEQVEAEWKTMGIDSWVTSQTTLESLRENFIQYRAKNSQETFQSEGAKDMQEIKANLFMLLRLAPIEEKIMTLLIDREGKLVSRDELVFEIWGTQATKSHLSQLSFRTGRIKKIIEDIYGIRSAILTDWNKGYRLDPYFYQQLTEQQLEVKHHLKK